MNRPVNSISDTRNYLGSGAIAGTGSSLIFMIIHDIFISDIWSSWFIMLLSGLVCGLCVAWSFQQLFKSPSIYNWVKYNMLYVGMFILLGIISVIIFEPVTTIAALIAANEPPQKLIQEALPMTVTFTLFMAIMINQLYGRSWKLFGIILLTCSLLVLLLGLNVSVIGLISIPKSSLYLILELFGLIISINTFYVFIFILFERKRWHKI